MTLIKPIEINIKNINNYEVYFHKCMTSYKKINVYEGKNIKTKEKVLVEVYDTEIIFLAKRIKNKIIKIEHPNIITILDIIVEFSNIYIIKPFYKTKINDVNISNFIKSKQIVRGIKYLFDKNIDIEHINIDNIYYDDIDNLLKLSPFFSPPITPKNILYGSPLYSPPEFLNINKGERENTFILILKSLFNDMFINNNINNNNNFNNNLNIIYKYLQNSNDCSLFEIYNFYESNIFNKQVNKENVSNKENSNDELFFMEM
jgi:hypothetical protein